MAINPDTKADVEDYAIDIQKALDPLYNIPTK